MRCSINFQKQCIHKKAKIRKKKAPDKQDTTEKIMQKIPSNKESYEVIVSNQDNNVADNDDFESQVVQKKLLFVADVTSMKSNNATIIDLLKTNQGTKKVVTFQNVNPNLDFEAGTATIKYYRCNDVVMHAEMNLTTDEKKNLTLDQNQLEELSRMIGEARDTGNN